MRHLSKKRFLVVGGAVTTVAAGAALIAGATFGFFSSSGDASGNNAFTAGEVVVGLNSGGTQVTCTIDPMAPGDDQADNVTGACKYLIKYTGNVDAYMALDIDITGAPGGVTVEDPYGPANAPTPANGLFDGTGNGLQLDIFDGATGVYVDGTDYTDESGAPINLDAVTGDASVANLLVSSTPVAENGLLTVTVNYVLPTTASNAYNLATSTIVLTIHAMQSDNVVLPAACDGDGEQCLTDMLWN